MNVLIFLGLLSLFLSLILTPVFRQLFLRWGFVDHPDETRKFHRYPIPRAGGVAIAASYVTAFLIVNAVTGILHQHLAFIEKILPAAAVIFLVGVIDDLFGLKPWQKLAGQFLAAGLICWNGIVILDVAGVHRHAWWSVPLTIVWLLACSNAFNLVDGMDGLAAGIGLFATLTTFVAALLQNNLPLAMATISLAGCLLGFLRYNFNPATVFLGDSGSLVIGFLLGCYGVVWVQKSATMLGITAPLIAFSIPLFDATLAIARRFLRTQPIFSPDRRHIHHRLLDRGMSPRKAALVLYAISGIAAVFSLLQSGSHSNQFASAIVLVFCAVAWMGIRWLGYIEFTLAGRFLFRGGLQRTLKAQIDLHALEKTLTEEREVRECARVVSEAAKRFGFTVTGMQLDGKSFSKPYRHSVPGWEVRVPLADGDFVGLMRETREGAAFTVAGPFIDVLRAGLCRRFAEAGEEQTAGVASEPLIMNPRHRSLRAVGE
jgi:UDP-GlcNAc:undecaprenyl-phosphate/decaprenyl-phosphate GlcNAc-1-phosphate transferase